MNLHPGFFENLKDQRGVTLVIFAGSLVMLLAFAALAIDIGYLAVSKNELQNVADASALAATRYIGHAYEGITDYSQQKNYTFSRASIVAVAQQAALQNSAGGVSIVVDDSDVDIGTWSQTTKTLTITSTYQQISAVQVRAHRDATRNGNVPTFVSGIIGINSMGISTPATASLTGQGTAGPGGLPIPIGIDKSWFTLNQCNDPIVFYPTACPGAGWHDYDGLSEGCGPNPSAACMKKIIDGLTDGTFISPPTYAGAFFNFTGGTLTSALQDFQTLFDVMKVKNDGVLDKDNNSSTWTTTVVVYDSGCGNPNATYKIVGFATAVITEVIDVGGNKQVNGVVVCNGVDPGRGGGGEYGTWGSIPGLVQ